MVRAPCCDKSKVKRGPWAPEEDATLKHHLDNYGTGGNWISLPQRAGLKRCGKSCRLRWLNYLRPDIKHGPFTDEEDNLILSLFQELGSRWSVIASKLGGRTDNDVKNHWNTKLKKRFMAAKNNFHISSTNTVLLDHHHGPIQFQFPAKIDPKFLAPLVLNPPPTTVIPEASSFVAAMDDNYIPWFDGGGGGSGGFTDAIADFVGGSCLDNVEGFWAQESVGVEDFMFPNRDGCKKLS